MFITSYFRHFCEGLYAADCYLTILSPAKFKYWDKIHFGETVQNPEGIRSFQRYMIFQWFLAGGEQCTSSLEAYYLDWYNSYRYRIDVIQDCVSKIEEAVRTHLPNNPSESIPGDIFKDHPIEGGVAVRVILRRLRAEKVGEFDEIITQRLVNCRDLIIKIINDVKEDIERDKLNRESDPSARMRNLTTLKKLDRKMTKTGLYKLARDAIVALGVYLVLKRFGIIKAPPSAAVGSSMAILV